MVTRVATDEGPLETPSSDESGMGRSDSPSDDSEPEAALVVPPDGGWGWMVVAASFCCCFVVDGVTCSGSALHEALKKEFNVGPIKVPTIPGGPPSSSSSRYPPRPSSHRSNGHEVGLRYAWMASDSEVAPVNSLLAGFYLLGGPFVSALANKYGFRIVTMLGAVVAAISFSLSYFASSVGYLYLSYGIFGGIGLCMIYMPAVLVVGFYFEKWRAMATGLALCGSGIGAMAMSPVNEFLIKNYGWRLALVANGVMFLACVLFGALFRPLKPVRVTLADQAEGDMTKRHEEAVEKLNSMLKLQSKFDSGISMPLEARFNSKITPHTWMGVASNTRYPTAEEVFKGSNSHLARRSSANAPTLRNHLGNKTTFITTPVVEKDEQDESLDNTEPLIGEVINFKTRDTKPRRSHADLVARPLYRDDIFFGASLTRLPQYTSRTSLGYHLAVTHVPTKEDAQEERSGKCKLCPEAFRRVLATMLDVSLFRSLTFNLLALSGFFTMLGFFVPFMYIMPRAEANGIDKAKALMMISSIGISNTIGRVVCGMISTLPKVSPLWLNNIALTAGGLALMMSGQSYNEAYQFFICAVFGIAIACFSSLRSILVVEYIGLEQLTNCFGLFLLFQGLGALLGGPIAGPLLNLRPFQCTTKAFFGRFAHTHTRWAGGLVSGALALVMLLPFTSLFGIFGWIYRHQSVPGKLKDMTQSYELSFYVCGSFFLISGVICYGIDCISRWEKSRSKHNTSKV